MYLCFILLLEIISHQIKMNTYTCKYCNGGKPLINNITFNNVNKLKNITQLVHLHVFSITIIIIISLPRRFTTEFKL